MEGDQFEGGARTRGYKPYILRVPGLLLVFAVNVTLIGVLEYAARTFPSAEKESYTSKNTPGLLHLPGRQIATTPTSTSSSPQIEATTGTTIPGAYVHTSFTSTTSSPQIEATTIPGAYVHTSSTSTFSSPELIVPTTSPDAYVHPSDSSVAPGAVATSVQNVGTNDPSAYLQTASGGSPLTTIAPPTGTTIAPIIMTSSTYVQTTEVLFSNGETLTIPTSTLVAATSNGAYIMITTHVPISTTPKATASGAYVQTTAASSGAYGQTTPPTPGPISDTGSPSWPLWKVFVGGYMPVFLAILYKTFWSSIYANVKLVEPFIQLSRPTGAVAKDAFWIFYLSSNITPDPIVSFFKRRWLMFWTSVVYLVVGFLPALASEALFRDTKYLCSNPDPNQPNNPCWPRLTVDITVIHLLQGLLSFVAIMTLSIMYMLFRSPTGVASDPSSIAFVATLIHHPDVLWDFRRISDQANEKQIVSMLGKKSYRLGSYLGSDGMARYGIIPGSSPYLLEDVMEIEHPSNENQAVGTKKVKRFLDGIFLGFVLGLLGVVLAYYKDGANDGFNRFFNSNSFGPRFFMSAMGSIIAMNFKRLEREVQTLSPFHQLAKSPSPAGPTILFRQYNIPFTAFFMLLAQGHIFSASITFAGFLSEALVVFLAAIPYAPGEVFLELLVCTYTSIGILSIMLLVLGGLLFWRRRLPYLPRAPDTLGGVISYLCDSHMLYNFDQCTELGNRELCRRIEGFGKEYSYGKYVGVDGQIRWMIEESTDSSSDEK